MPQKMINNEKMPDKLYEAIAYMKEHLADSPSLRETAGYVHICPNFLSLICIRHIRFLY